MSKGPYPFKPSDIERAVVSARKVGLEPHTIEIQAPNGTIIRVIGGKAVSNDLDRELEEFEKRHGTPLSS
jgi:hypothetical protein